MFSRRRVPDTMHAAPATGEHDDVLTFKVGGEVLSLPASQVAEIIRMRAVTRVPHGPAALLGLTNLRGTVLPVLSVSGLIGQPVTPPRPSSRIVVTGNGVTVGLLVDEVSALAKPHGETGLDLPALLAPDFGRLSQKRGRVAANREPSIPAEPGAASQDILLLIGFDLGGQGYALPIDKVVEVRAFPDEVSNVAGTDQAMIGVTNLRGGLLSLVSLKFLLGLPAVQADRDRQRVIVTRVGGALVGLVVDEMKAILRVPADAIDPVPHVLTRGRGEARIEAICRLDGGRLVSVLAPAQLFDDETAARILAGADRGAAQMTKTECADDVSEQFVIFRLGDEDYGLPILSVHEVVRRPDQLTRVPRAPAFVEGVMNLRGKIVPVVNQRERFSVAGETAAHGQRIVIVTIDGVQAGFVVDAVSDIIAIPARNLQPTPELSTDGAQLFDRVANIAGGGRIILLIDPRQLMDRVESDLLAAIVAEVAPAS